MKEQRPRKGGSARTSMLNARLGIVACAALMLQPVALEAATIPIPQVKPIPDDGNLPLNSAVFTGSRDYGDFARYGYVEEEYYISGNASTRDEESGAIVKADLPYVSRIIVRRPVNPKAFSGNVVVEGLHGLLEKSEIWEQTHGYMERNGDIWVGVTVKAKGLDMDIKNGQNLGGVPVLKIYDPVRYAPLHLEDDLRPLHPAPPAPTPPQGIDLTMQVGALFKENKGPLPKGFDVKRAFAIGGGINGEIVSGIVRTHQDEMWRLPSGKKIFDGYFGAVNNRVLEPPKDAVYAMFHSENETTLEANLGYVGKEADTRFFKVYDVPGTAHLGSRNFNPSSEVQVNAVLPNPARGVDYAMDSASCPNMNDDPVDVFMSAILARVELAAKDGTPLPPAPLPELAPGDPGATLGSASGAGLTSRVATLKRDPVSGNVLGGVRMPWVEAPIANYNVPADMFVKMAAMAAMMAHGGPPGGPPGAAPPGGAPGMNGPPPGAGGPPGAEAHGDVIHSRPAGMMMPPVPPVLAPTDSWQRASKEPIKGSQNRPAFCMIFTPRVAYDRATLRKLYPSYDAYVAKFEAAKANAVKQGWILREDAETLRPRGRPEDF